MKNGKEVPLEIINNRKKFQKSRVPEICKEFELKKVVVEKNTFRYDGIIAEEPIEFSAKCEHHCVGINGRVYFAYIPSDLILGLSQAARIIEYFLNVTEEVIQEEATKVITDYMEKNLSPKGIWIVIKAKHECMSARGVRQRNTKSTTSVLRGDFLTNPEIRQETVWLWTLP